MPTQHGAHPLSMVAAHSELGACLVSAAPGLIQPRDLSPTHHLDVQLGDLQLQLAVVLLQLLRGLPAPRRAVAHDVAQIAALRVRGHQAWSGASGRGPVILMAAWHGRAHHVVVLSF